MKPCQPLQSSHLERALTGGASRSLLILISFSEYCHTKYQILQVYLRLRCISNTLQTHIGICSSSCLYLCIFTHIPSKHKTLVVYGFLNDSAWGFVGLWAEPTKRCILRSQGLCIPRPPDVREIRILWHPLCGTSGLLEGTWVVWVLLADAKSAQVPCNVP